MTVSSLFVATSIFLLLNYSSFCMTQDSCPDPPSPSNSTSPSFLLPNSILTLATFNAKWLFDGVDDPSYSPWNGTAAAEQHIMEIGSLLLSLDSHIINLVEVEDCTTLSLLFTLHPTFSSQGYNYFLKKGKDSATKQDVALLTMFPPETPLVRTENRSDFPLPDSECGSIATGDSGVSKHFYTQVMIDMNDDESSPFTLHLFSLHLIAYPTYAERCNQREAQAKVIQDFVTLKLEEAGHLTGYVNGHGNILHPSYGVVILGDLNDYDSQISDSHNNTPTSRVLSMLKQSINGIELNNVMSLLPQEQRFSYGRTPSSKAMIDHILVSPNLFKIISTISIKHNTSIIYNDYISDHYPIVVSFDFNNYFTQVSSAYITSVYIPTMFFLLAMISSFHLI